MSISTAPAARAAGAVWNCAAKHEPPTTSWGVLLVTAQRLPKHADVRAIDLHQAIEDTCWPDPDVRMGDAARSLYWDAIGRLERHLAPLSIEGWWADVVTVGQAIRALRAAAGVR